ncbi:hypothetical protein GXM_00246 [Nostoc sphaeroides CCNUC1]|uniref:Uncharacterized protein n=1 Tax=Nostoc sphaeroides CCNUC1 TaxID=2653204 RepID=A0A5P8VQQ6_9NOSO|nr:hypothetical protein GXM_00246 [Nostoc sphaeroides CCNUC1]
MHFSAYSKVLSAVAHRNLDLSLLLARNLGKLIKVSLTNPAF